MSKKKRTRTRAKKAVTLSKQTETKKTDEREPPKPPLRFIMATEQFFSDIDVLSESFRTVIPVIEDKDKQQQKEVEVATDELSRAVEALQKGKVKGRVQTQHLEAMSASVVRVVSGARKLHRASRFYRHQALVLLVALLDNFTGEILGIIFKSKPEILRGSDKTIPVEEYSRQLHWTNLLQELLELKRTRSYACHMLVRLIIWIGNSNSACVNHLLDTLTL